MSRPQALAIARAFLPAHPLGNRYDYYYTRTKLRTDPLYPGVLAALRGSDAPVMDLGCGLGLLAHALRADGQAQAYHGVDIDAAKIRRAIHIAQRSGLHATRFDVVDLGQSWPEHHGSVAILDVLQYLDGDMQASLIRSVATMLSPGAKLVIRSGLGDDSGRGRTSRVTDVLAHLAGWMQEVPKCYPTRDSLERQLADAGLQATFAPLYGNTPFNNWLIVATRR
ncbi:class I SAM-dependent methyltransferase [Xanthomonas sp. AmX2]|uniref:class I SAM-dependent methyltransferase n=1 Tax=Xanthomonas sp. TaxID=29446 RepID=UPI00197F6D1B|nr:class I SAM-dependent methyltransferase [Xanthomonas sp.]MBN6151675.1 class I SAM-dependent methyltransferase [Xanthomonas sp.]